MIINDKLNKKQQQQIIGWVMMTSIMLLVLRTTLALFNLPEVSVSSLKIFYYLYYFIIITGGLFIYVLREKRNG
jgi:hypothetical protein